MANGGRKKPKPPNRTGKESAVPTIYLTWNEWGFRYRVRHYRLCESSYEHTVLAIGPIWLEWNELV
jgi:hypothetical protein